MCSIFCVGYRVFSRHANDHSFVGDSLVVDVNWNMNKEQGTGLSTTLEPIGSLVSRRV